MILWLLPTSAHADEVVWRDHDNEGHERIHLYFFWSASCPHCQEARPVVHELAERHDWLAVHSHEITSDPAAAKLYVLLAESLGEQAQYVPAFAYCETLTQGFPGAAELERELLACHGGRAASESDLGAATIELPWGGELDVSRWSLPLTTVVLAGLDAFNPCAFFVLLFLLSLLVRSSSRARMLVVSAIFVVFSGVWYFVFMAAWLNLFLWFGALRWLTVLAGVVAVVMAAINIKDFFVPERGPSLSIPDSAKPSLFARMRRLVSASSLPSAVLGTIVLAAAANSYELLCTAGLPMVYTRVLTLAELPVAGYYLYLVLYNLVYVTPLVIIVVVSIKTLGSHKLQEREGRALKLMSGLMMLGLGLALVFAPDLLARLGLALLLLLGAGGLTAAAVVLDRRRARLTATRGSAP